MVESERSEHCRQGQGMQRCFCAIYLAEGQNDLLFALACLER